MAKATEYNVVNNKPCWLDILTQVEPEQTPLYVELKKGVKPTKYSYTYFVDKIGSVSLDTVGDSTGVDSAKFENHAANRKPIEVYVQEQYELWNLSRGESNGDADPAGVSNEVEKAKSRAAVKLRLKIERSIGSDQVGEFVSEAVGGHMIALGSFLDPENATIPDYARTAAGAVAETDNLTEDAFRAVLQSVYDVCGDSGAKYNLYAGSDLQTKITNFMRMVDTPTFLRTQKLDGSVNEISAAVNIYRGDFGLVKVIPNAQLGFVSNQDGANAVSKARGYLLNMDYVELNFVHDIYNKDLPDTDASGLKGAMFAKYGLICRSPKTCGKFVKAA